MSSATTTVLPGVWVVKRKCLSAVQQAERSEQMVPSGHCWSLSTVSLDAAEKRPSLVLAVLSSVQHPHDICTTSPFCCVQPRAESSEICGKLRDAHLSDSLQQDSL